MPSQFLAPREHARVVASHRLRAHEDLRHLREASEHAPLCVGNAVFRAERRDLGLHFAIAQHRHVGKEVVLDLVVEPEVGEVEEVAAGRVVGRADDLPGEPGDPEHSWIGLMLFDYITMVTALGGDASALEAVEARNVAPDEATYPQ